MGSLWAMVVVEGDPAPDASPGLRPSLPGVQIDAFILQGPPEALDEDVVEAAPFAVQRDPGPDPLKPVGSCEGRELAALIGVHDLWWAELVDRLVPRLEAELSLMRVRYPPGQNLALNQSITASS
jgi:hypothetical protein